MRKSFSFAPTRYAQKHSVRGDVMSRHTARRGSGFTLIEVIIAMAIFVVGAVAIVRIFPPALGVIQNSESRAIATREARSVLAKWSSDPSSVPDWIYDSGMAVNDEPIAMLGTTIRTRSLPDKLSFASMGQSALGRFKQIEGEKHRVIQEAPGGVPGNKYIFTDFSYAGNVTLTREYTIDGVRIADFGATEGGYLFDFTNANRSSDGASWSNNAATPPLAPADARNSRYPRETAANFTYYISYRWIARSGQVNSVVDEAYRFVNAASLASSDPTPLKPLQARRIGGGTTSEFPQSIIEGEVSVRVVEEVGTAAAAQPGDEFRGIVPVTSTSINAGDTIGVNYTVLNWDWMLYDGPLSNPVGPLPEAMPTPAATEEVRVVTLPVKGLNDGIEQHWVHSALMPAPVEGKTSALIKRNFWDPAAPSGDFHVNDKRSDVLFKLNPTTIKSPRVRIAYRTQDSWARQAAVAARSYVPFVNTADFQASGTVAPDSTAGTRPSNSPSQPWREYLWEAASPSYIYFRPSEAGKTVMVSFKHAISPTETKTVNNAVFTVDDEFINLPDGAFGMPTDSKPTLACRLELLDSKGLPIAATAILSIRGLSVHARTAWVDNGRYNQSVASGYRRSDL